MTTTSEVPGKFDIGLNGVGYMLDTSEGSEHRHVTVPLLRTQADTSDQPGERSINPEGPWRISRQSWHRGAGQRFADLQGGSDDSDPYRFNASRGLDVWTRNEVSCLPAVDPLDDETSEAGSSAVLAVAGSYFYASLGGVVKHTQDPTGSVTWTTVSGVPSTVKSMTSDGTYVYLTDGADVYRMTAGDAAAGSAWNTTNMDLLVWVRGKGRLMAALNTGTTRSVYNVTSTAAPTDIKPDVIGPAFTWVGFAETASAILGAGFQGDKSLIFRWGIKEDGTGLDAAVPALADGLPDGEIVRSIYGYLGFVLIGTDQGVRLATADASGNLTVGALIETPGPVRCFEGQGRFVWFGVDDAFDDAVGLWRLDLTEFNGSAPAYATDLMTPLASAVEGDVTSVVTFGDRRYFATQDGTDDAAWRQGPSHVQTLAYLEQGEFTFNLPDNKVALRADVRCDPLTVASLTVDFSMNGGAYGNPASVDYDSGTGGSQALETETFERLQPKIRFGISGSDLTESPVLNRLTLHAIPAVKQTDVIFVSVRLFETVPTRTGGDHAQSPASMLTALRALRDAQTVVDYQDGGVTYSVVVEQIEWRPEHPTRNGDAWNGVAHLRLKVVA